ncbi:MAG: ArnT family glycosyltransferase [Planctomycetota bacterium]
MSIAYLLIAALLLPAYGPTWDCALGDFAFGERILASLWSGEPVFLDPGAPSGLVHRDPHILLQYVLPWSQLYPFAATLSALSCRILWTWLGLVPSLYAHHLPGVVLVGILVYVLVRFVGRRLGHGTAIAAALFLVSSPRFFAHAFNNLKDSPEACTYGFAVLATYVAITSKSLLWWCGAGFLTALALAQKTNALFIPLQMGLFLLFDAVVSRRERRDEKLFAWRGLLAASLVFVPAYYALSPQLWTDPLARLSRHVDQMLEHGNIMTGALGQLAPPSPGVSWHGPYHVLVTTPPAVLVLAAVGILAPGFGTRLRAFLVLWLLVPVGRVALPGMRDFDGVRHFLEFYPAIAILAAAGLSALLRGVLALCGSRVVLGAILRVAAIVLTIGSCAAATARTHPNGVCYFNALVGGLGGAQAAGIPDSTDYWGNSYWQGLAWLDGHAGENASLIVLVAPHIVRCAAPLGLRADIRQLRRDAADISPPLYVMYVTRRLPPLGLEIAKLEDAPVHEIRVQGGIILRIHEFGDARAVARFQEIRTERDARTRRATERVTSWMAEDPVRSLAVMRIFQEAVILGFAASERRLHALMPGELHEDATEWLRALLPR